MTVRNTIVEVRRDGEAVARFTEDGPQPATSQAFAWLLKNQPHSVDHALRHEGYSIVSVFADGSVKDHR